jgi:hypothetical protein
VQKAVIELKILHKSLDITIADGLMQTWENMQRCQADDAHLIVFDRREDIPLEKKLFRRDEKYQG